MHHNSVNCDSNKVIKDVEKNLDYASRAKKLYPKRLKVTRAYDEEDRYDKLNSNGGWSDIRDHLLCLNMTINLR
jgi:alpha-1,6-mannosyl-glycoprotein beta-1,2-N-acetylglucosaminyltransferase